ncbi:MAG: hypothetical protein Q4G52_04390, partial [Clostridia bacterium]|nr:hypothetical protein [Clostridia bacterium]
AENGLYYIEFQMCIDGVPICSDEQALEIQYTIYSESSIVGIEAVMVLSKDRVLYADFSYEYDLSGIQKVDVLSEEEIGRIIREEVEDNLLISAPEKAEMEFMYLYIRHGTGKNAKYELRPVWRVYAEGKSDRNYIAFFDAESGKILF